MQSRRVIRDARYGCTALRRLRMGRKGKDAMLPAEVPRNEKGGVLVTEEEIEAAFKFFDMDKNGCITSASLKERLKLFNENYGFPFFK